MADVHLLLKSFLMLLLAGGQVSQLKRHYWMSLRRSVTAVALDENGWRIRSPDSITWVQARLLPYGWVQPWIMILPFETDVAPYRRTLILMKGSASVEIIHRLHVVLRAAPYKVTAVPVCGVEGAIERWRGTVSRILKIKRAGSD